MDVVAVVEGLPVVPSSIYFSIENVASAIFCLLCFVLTQLVEGD